MGIVGVQGESPQGMPPWHAENFELKTKPNKLKKRFLPFSLPAYENSGRKLCFQKRALAYSP